MLEIPPGILSTDAQLSSTRKGAVMHSHTVLYDLLLISSVSVQMDWKYLNFEDLLTIVAHA